MTKLKHLVLTLVHCFKQFAIILFLFFINISQSILAQEEVKSDKIEKINFPAAVIDMKLVLAKSSAFYITKRNSKIRKNYKEEIQNEENLLKKEQEKL